MVNLGVIFAIIAMFSWGFGDFLIQKNTRRVGLWTTLFFVTITGAIILTPFSVSSAHELLTHGLWIFLLAGIVYFVAAFLDLKALMVGKLDVVEPLWCLEIVSSGLLALFVLKETITTTQLLFIIILVLSLVLLSLKSLNFSRKVILEKGVFIASLAAIIMGAANFFIGIGSRITNPVVMKWGLDLFLAFFSLFFILGGSERKVFFKGLLNNKKSLVLMSLFDNAAWLAFGFAMVLAPISITVAISESYIIIAVLLGLFVNKEKLRRHQIISLFFALASAIYLASTII